MREPINFKTQLTIDSKTQLWNVKKKKGWKSTLQELDLKLTLLGFDVGGGVYVQIFQFGPGFSTHLRNGPSSIFYEIKAVQHAIKLERAKGMYTLNRIA